MHKVVFHFGETELELQHRFKTTDEAVEAAKAAAADIEGFLATAFNLGTGELKAIVTKIDPAITVWLQSPVSEEELTEEGFVEGEREPSLGFETPEGTFNPDIHPLQIARYVEGLRKLYPNIEVNG